MSAELALDWREWATRRERQQNGGLPGRERRCRLMLGVVEKQRGDRAIRLLDLCCGPGPSGARALARFPLAPVAATDIDAWTVATRTPSSSRARCGSGVLGTRPSGAFGGLWSS